MKYSELNDLWKLQKEQYTLWLRSLNQQAAKLRNEVLGILQPASEEWTNPDNGHKRSYVELFDISDKPQPVSGLGFTSESLTDVGELIFGIAITFDHGLQTFPKKTQYMPVSLRFINKEPQFSFFNMQTRKSESKWEPDVKVFAKTLVDEAAKHLMFDPLDGPPNRSSIGFL